MRVIVFGVVSFFLVSFFLTSVSCVSKNQPIKLDQVKVKVESVKIEQITSGVDITHYRYLETNETSEWSILSSQIKSFQSSRSRVPSPSPPQKYYSLSELVNDKWIVKVLFTEDGELMSPYTSDSVGVQKFLNKVTVNGVNCE